MKGTKGIDCRLYHENISLRCLSLTILDGSFRIGKKAIFRNLEKLELARISKFDLSNPTKFLFVVTGESCLESLRVECDVINSFPKLKSLHLFGVFTNFDISLLKDQIEELTLGHTKTNDDNFVISGYNKLKKLRLEDYSLCHVKKIENLDELVELELQAGGRFFESHEFGDCSDWDYFKTGFSLLENLPKLKYIRSSDNVPKELYFIIGDDWSDLNFTLKDLPGLTNIELQGFPSDIELHNTPNIEVVNTTGVGDFGENDILIGENDNFKNLHTLNLYNSRITYRNGPNKEKEVPLGNKFSPNLVTFSKRDRRRISEIIISSLENIEFLDMSESFSKVVRLENCPRLKEARIRLEENSSFSNLPSLKKLQIEDCTAVCTDFVNNSQDINPQFMGVVKQFSRSEFSLEHLKFNFSSLLTEIRPSQIMIDSDFISNLKKLEIVSVSSVREEVRKSLSFNFDGEDCHGIREINLYGFAEVILQNLPELEKCSIVRCSNVNIKNCDSLN